ncbi:MAG: V-type ATP synthase subunit A [Candidatus Rehaiarchaeum fermentans]|nr:V-type ATP synthase subunit A [Candidatus Rehaiarchaeum fermentans]
MAIKRISGPLVVAEGLSSGIGEVVRLGKKRIIGEVIRIRGKEFFIEAYEDTSSLGVGEEVEETHFPLSVVLGPGMLGKIYDGLQRALDSMLSKEGIFIHGKEDYFPLDTNKKWDFYPLVKKGDKVREGQIIGKVREGNIDHFILVPLGFHGEVNSIKEGSFTVKDPICTIENKEVFLYQRWPIRKPRPYLSKLDIKSPLVTGQRVIDFLFPIGEGGKAAIPGPFGSGKTVLQHQLAKWASSDIVVYVGCGERGNEMADLLESFSNLVDSNGNPLLQRTVLIANTSNMPVAAREASIYVGITIAEYFRDLGYKVSVMADSTSRWAEALREISGRLEEMPGEEGYPSYLGSRLAEFYERAGKVKTLSGKEGSVTVIGAVSPPGGDLSDPVSQNTLRLVRCFWGLDAKLAYSRHYPAINWGISYSLYIDDLEEWFKKSVGNDYNFLREWILNTLNKSDEIQQIANLVGFNALPDQEKETLKIARLIKEGFLIQSAFDENDAYSSLKKQYIIVKAIKLLYDKEMDKILKGQKFDEIKDNDFVQTILKMKIMKDDEIEKEFEKLSYDLQRI